MAGYLRDSSWQLDVEPGRVALVLGIRLRKAQALSLYMLEDDFASAAGVSPDRLESCDFVLSIGIKMQWSITS